jgi:hypothetical protein
VESKNKKRRLRTKKLITGKNLNGRVKRIAFLAAVLAMRIVVADVGSGESANYGSFEEWGEKYLKAGTIRINDPKLLTFGSVDGDKAILHFNLVDIGKFAGHLCAGSTSGFMITKLALKNLYADREIPERGDIVLTTSAKGEPMEIAAFITGVSDEDHFGLVSWVVDLSLSKNRGLFVFVFERLSTGRKVKITWNKSKTLKDHVGDLKKFKKKR